MLKPEGTRSLKSKEMPLKENHTVSPIKIVPSSLVMCHFAGGIDSFWGFAVENENADTWAFLSPVFLGSAAMA